MNRRGAQEGNKNSVKHGYSSPSTPEYRAWKGMRSRLRDKRFKHRYADRGIAICIRWDSFPSFLDDMGAKPDGPERYTLERIDNDKGYSPENCKWATYTEQENNRSDSRRIAYKGETKSVAMWARELGMHRNALLYRLEHMPVEEAMSKPRRKHTVETKSSRVAV